MGSTSEAWNGRQGSGKVSRGAPSTDETEDPHRGSQCKALCHPSTNGNGHIGQITCRSSVTVTDSHRMILSKPPSRSQCRRGLPIRAHGVVLKLCPTLQGAGSYGGLLAMASTVLSQLRSHSSNTEPGPLHSHWLLDNAAAPAGPTHP